MFVIQILLVSHGLTVSLLP